MATQRHLFPTFFGGLRARELGGPSCSSCATVGLPYLPDISYDPVGRGGGVIAVERSSNPAIPYAISRPSALGRISGRVPALLPEPDPISGKPDSISGASCGRLDDARAGRGYDELDVSNNRLSGGFPQHILCLPSVKYVDLRFNDLCGPVPPALFDKPLDAIFLNDYRFDFEIPDSLGNSPASVLVLANLRLRGCIPRSVGHMAGTLTELMALNSGLRSCLPQEVGWLRELTVLDLSANQLQGMLPESMAGMHKLQQLDVARNELWGHVPEGVYALPALRNFTYSYNYYCSEPRRCLDVRQVDDRQNCIAGRPDQRPADQCLAFLHRQPVRCDDHGCFGPPPHF